MYNGYFTVADIIICMNQYLHIIPLHTHPPVGRVKVDYLGKYGRNNKKKMIKAIFFSC